MPTFWAVESVDRDVTGIGVWALMSSQSRAAEMIRSIVATGGASEADLRIVTYKLDLPSPEAQPYFEFPPIPTTSSSS